MNITFLKLQEKHFPLMLKWLNTSHVKKWWDDGLDTLEAITEKYKSYVNGYKDVNSVRKPIDAYIIFYNKQPIGYFQFYNAYDFPRSEELKDFPGSLGAFDIFIGEEAYVGKGIGSYVLKFFLETKIKDYDYVFADPEHTNVAAINAYENAGFKKIVNKINTQSMWMIWGKNQLLNQPNILF
jgi:RimJ/RimL family protein N-acetyltransferase